MIESTGPAPMSGQKWNLFEYMKKGIEFTTMLGTFVIPGQGQEPPFPPPALGELSLHFWHLKDRPDDQTPHKQDEAYLVLGGHGILTIDGRPSKVQPGDLIFVPRCADHRFSDISEEGLSLLVIFGPNYKG